jgi:mono/diheme cytochrome c family protein
MSLALVYVLTACSPPTPTPTSGPVLTTTPIPTFSRDEPTAPPSVATAAAATSTAAAAGSSALDPVVVERGLGRYQALECGSCHGEAGEGTDEGASLQAYTADEETFITFIRSGGTLGTDHQYSTNRLSDSGGRNLYQYLVSLRGE